MALAGCGSTEALPAPEAPSSRTETAYLDTRARTLTVGNETVDAGVGPFAAVESAERVYVPDAVQRSLLVFEKEPELHLQRRTYLGQAPASVRVTREDVVVTLAGGDRVILTPGGVER